MHKWFQSVGRVGRDLLPQPWWLFLPFFVMVCLGTSLAFDTLRERQEAHRRSEVEQREFRRQEIQTLQALVEEVRQLRAVLEAH
jgi:hypothetical protein